MIKTTCLLICLAFGEQLSFAQNLAGQTTSSPQFGEHQSTPEQRATMDRWNAESFRVNKIVQPLLKKARELWDSGDPVTASRYYDKASSIQRTFYDVPADLILEESLVAQGRYREAVGIGLQYVPTVGKHGPTVGMPIWLIVSDCEMGQFDEAERLMAANSGAFAGLLRGFACGVPPDSERSPDVLRATAWFLLESIKGPLHTPQARFNWLKRAHSFSKRNALIELRMAELLNGPLKQPGQALMLLEDAKHQIGTAQLTADDPLNEVGHEYDIALGLIRSAAIAKKEGR